jgi:hypothetical protein
MMTRLKHTVRVSLVASAVLSATSCSSSAGSPAGQDGGLGAGSSDGSIAAATEPAYLRNDTIAGFAYTANFGSPYDSILAAPLNTTQSAIAPGFKTEPAAGQVVASERFQLIANSSDLYSALNISASLSVSTGLASVNAKTSFAKSTQIDSTDLWVLADFSQEGATQKILDPTLTAQAAALSPEDFYGLYGDRYAAEIVTGAEMFCTVQIHTYSQQDKSELTASLGFSYGASSGSASFSTSSMSATMNRSVNVTCDYLGFTPMTVVTDLPTLLDAATAFQSGGAGTLGNVTTSTLYLLYTSYYGIPGYPGVPAGTADKVAKQGQLASDYLLYDSLVNKDFAAYYADPSYSSLPFFAHMKSYHDGLAAFLAASITSSQNPGAPVPTPSADGVITDWVTATTLSSPPGTPQFTVYGMANGVVPKKISDYAIPLRYAYPDASGSGTLNGVSFTPVTPVPSVASVTSTEPVDYPLYLTRKSGSGGGLWLEYQWDTGTYYFPNGVDATGAPDASLIGSAITAFGLSGNLASQYVVVNKANGLVMTENGAMPMTATHFASGNGSQLWEFYLDAGGVIKNCNTYVAPGGPPGTGCAESNNGVVSVANNPPCGSQLYVVSAAAIAAKRAGYWEVTGSAAGSPINSNGGGGCQDCNWNCGAVSCDYTSCGGGPVPTDDFFLQAYDNGSTRAIYNFAGSGGGVVSYVVTDQNQTMQNLPATSSGPVENVVVGPNNGDANALWVFIPSTNIDTTP